MTAVDAVAGQWPTPDAVADLPVTRVLICDERPMTSLALATTVRATLPLAEIECVTDGFQLADAFAGKRATVVLIGYQPGRSGGAQATDLLLSLHPSAAVIAFGAPDASALLAAAMDRGARGLMLWESTGTRRRPGRLDGWSAQAPGRTNPGRPSKSSSPNANCRCCWE